MTRLPGWLIESIADLLDVPLSAMHMAVVEDGAAALEQQPQAFKVTGWWGE